MMSIDPVRPRTSRLSPRPSVVVIVVSALNVVVAIVVLAGLAISTLVPFEGQMSAKIAIPAVIVSAACLMIIFAAIATLRGSSKGQLAQWMLVTILACWFSIASIRLAVVVDWKLNWWQWTVLPRWVALAIANFLVLKSSRVGRISN